MRTRLFVALIAAVACAWAQPRIRDAQVQTRSAAADLQKTVASISSAQTAPAWIGWSEPLVAGQHSICWNERGETSKRAVNLESPQTLNVFLRRGESPYFEGPAGDSGLRDRRKRCGRVLAE